MTNEIVIKTKLPTFFCNEPFASQLMSGKKWVEAYVGDHTEHVGKNVMIYSNFRAFELKVLEVRKYKDLYSFIADVDLEAVAPNLKSKDDLLEYYRTVFQTTDEWVAEKKGITALIFDHPY